MTSREIDVECPSCSPDKKVLHQVLRAGAKLVIRCAACHATHQIETRHDVGVVKLKVVVSHYDKSYVRRFELGAREWIHLEDEIIVENSLVDVVRVNAIELRDGARTIEAVAESIAALWAERIDRVVVKIAVHEGKTTRSYSVPFDGEKEFVIGAEEKLGKIVRIKVKRGPVLDRIGQSALAKDVRRVYIAGPARRNADRRER